jgi:hypothetical protein
MVKECVSKWGLRVKFFPPNMTDALQTMDRIVNAPVKADFRRCRAESLWDTFDKFKLQRDTARRPHSFEHLQLRQ